LLSLGDALVEPIDCFDGRDCLLNPKPRKSFAKTNVVLAQGLARDLLSLLFKEENTKGDALP